MSTFPRCLEQVTPEWITAALRRAEACGGASVVSFTATPPPSPGGASDGFILDLTYDSVHPSAPARLFIKFAPADPTKREMPRQYGYFPREVGFYRELGARGGDDIPRCYAAEIDEARGLFVLLLEYIESRPFGEDGLEPENAERIIRAMIPMQVAWWNRPELDSMPWLQDGRKDKLLRDGLATAPLVLQITESLAQFFPEGVARTMDQFASGPLVTLAVATPDGAPSVTLMHGELHQRQVLLRAAPAMSPVIIDWQTAGIGPAAFDVARLLASSMQPKLRRKHEADLVNLHYDLLCSAGIESYSRESHWAYYRYSLLWALWSSMGIARFTDPEKARLAFGGDLDAWRYVVLTWPAKAVRDNGLADLVPKWKYRARTLAAKAHSASSAGRISMSRPASRVSPTGFPRELGEVTPEWLTSILQRSNACGDARVTGFTASIPADIGGASEQFLLDLTYSTKDPGAPKGLFVKLAPANPDVRATLHRESYFRREVRFYQEVAGRLWCEAPRCFTAEIDEASGTFVVLLESVASKPQLRSGLKAESVESIIRALAALHAAWWNRPIWESMPWLLDTRSDQVLGQALGFAPQVMPVATTFSEFLPDAATSVLSSFIHGPLLNAATVATDGPPAFTLTHGDFHRKQVLLGTDPSTVPVIIDWQTVGIRPAAYDLAHFLTSSIDPVTRRAHEADLVNLHYDLLRGRGVADYSRDTHWAQYRCSLLWALWSNMCKVRFGDLEKLRKQIGGAPESLYQVLLSWPAEAIIDNGLDGLVGQWQRRAVSSAVRPSRAQRASTIPPPPS